MTPQQRNDYSFLPKHPMPMGTDAQRHTNDRNMIPYSIVQPLAFGPDWHHWLAVAAVAFFACMGGWILHGQVSHQKLSESFNAGLKIGAICAHDPMIAACSGRFRNIKP